MYEVRVLVTCEDMTFQWQKKSRNRFVVLACAWIPAGRVGELAGRVLG